MQATDKQLNFLRKLVEEREGLDEFVVCDARRRLDWNDQGNAGISKREASGWIDALLAIRVPRKSPQERVAKIDLPDVPAGEYALVIDGTTEFFKVDRPERGKWAGFIFLARESGANHAPIKQLTEKSRILGFILADLEGAARRYGHHKRRCGFCRIKLTDSFSRFFGVGPKCARDHGMPFSFASYLKAHPEDAAVMSRWQEEDADLHNDNDDYMEQRLREKAEFARYEREQENAAYAAKMERDRRLFDADVVGTSILSI